MVTFTDRLSDDNDYKREELIKKIEHALGQMTLKELEALSYDMFTKDILKINPTRNAAASALGTSYGICYRACCMKRCSASFSYLVPGLP